MYGVFFRIKLEIFGWVRMAMVCAVTTERFLFISPPNKVGLSGMSVRGMLQDMSIPQGDNWFATDGRVSRYDPSAVGAASKAFINSKYVFDFS